MHSTGQTNGPLKQPEESLWALLRAKWSPNIEEEGNAEEFKEKLAAAMKESAHAD